MASVSRILVAEDEPQVRRVLRDALVLAGFSVDDVGDGREVLRRCSETSYDVLVLDYAMPRLTGLEAVAELRDRGIRAPVVLMSGAPKTADRLDLLSVTYRVEVLRKPFGIGELRRVVNRLIPPGA